MKKIIPPFRALNEIYEHMANSSPDVRDPLRLSNGSGALLSQCLFSVWYLN